ncbi:hypothetical protein H1P_1280008 [Hyella patelloides LEGE 07179]|uniref:DUF2264 domain-containing protein n=1 Tax=Hyella patelloides LEGE 07179 TaxID=945734 RepID=A0A563VKU3_9CYAN|nr:hypothetical protein [Hyella patelloides]VEP11953.1 hypothetical protein H1P_1280008 [Hyella patelloides LEGE 07179]
MLNSKFLSNNCIRNFFSITLVVGCQIALPCIAQDLESEKLWQQKSQLVIDHLADNYVIPRSGDLGKYVMPGLIAYRWRYPDNDWQAKQKQQLQLLANKKPEDFYTNSEAFNSPGMTRLLYLYPQDKLLQQVEQQYFNYLFPPVDRVEKYNFWSSGGTENFVNMLRTSGYLLAQKATPLKLPKVQKRLTTKEKWLRQKARKTYQRGVAEWDSSSYTVFNLIGWLNVYDFAENEEIKAIAKAVLDYYASAVALKYTHGVYGGAEQRGGSAISSFNSYTDYLGWFWFSEYIPSEDSFFDWPQYIQLIHPATSSYRPPQEAIALARKQQPTSSFYQNAKAQYNLAKLEIPEVFYIGKTYTLGTALVNVGEQVVNWKLVSYPTTPEQALVVTGSNSFGKNNSKNGMGKTIFDRYLQHHNILVQMSYVPEEVTSQLKKQQFRQFIVNVINNIPCGNTCRHLLRSKVNKSILPITYPIAKQNNKYYVTNYLSFPENTKIINRQGTYFVQLNETYLAIAPFPPQPNLKPQVKEKNNRVYLESTAPLDTLTGFVVEVGNKLEHQSFSEFQNLVSHKTQLDLKQLDWEKIRYRTIDNQQLLIDYEKSQLQATLKVNSEPVTFQHPYLYQGKNLQLKNRILTLKSAESVYQVNFQNEVPIFKRTEK